MEGSWPALPSERTWGFWALPGNSASAGVATRVYIIGGSSPSTCPPTWDRRDPCRCAGGDVAHRARGAARQPPSTASTRSRTASAGPTIAIAVVLLGVHIHYLLVTHVGWSDIMAARPSAPSDSRLWNYVTGFEILVIASVGWWPYVGGLVRLVPSARRALWPAVIGLGLPMALLCVIGLPSGLAFPRSGGDPPRS